MGLVFDELIRRFAESSNETAGEHFTPRDIVRLTTSLVFMEDDDALTEGQELNPESYAICKGDMLIKEQEVRHIKLGNTLSDDSLLFLLHLLSKMRPYDPNDRNKSGERIGIIPNATENSTMFDL